MTNNTPIADKMSAALSEILVAQDMNGEEGSALLQMFFGAYMKIATPYVLGLIEENRASDAKAFFDGEVALFESVFRNGVIAGCVLQGLEHPWIGPSHNEQLVQDILAEEEHKRRTI